MRSRLYAVLSASLFAACLSAAGPQAAQAQEPAAAAATPTPAPTAAVTTVAAEAARGTRVPLAQASSAFDASGREALSATLSTQALAGTPDAPVRNVRLVLSNAGQAFYNYVAGYATFYDEGGVRCGAGLFTFGAAAVGERVETDTPGLRLTCTPAAWRVVATTLLTEAGDAAQPRTAAASAPAQPAAQAAPNTSATAGAGATPGLPPLEINVNGKTVPVQLNNPLELLVGTERVRIVVQPAP